jgi:hypothetical protein
MVERWRRAGAHDPSAAHGPIDPAMTLAMSLLADVLDETFNGKGCKPEDKKVGFFLTTFEFNAPGRFNYISNADKLDVRAMLADVLARIEGRLAAGPGGQA